jgi:NTE family protein
MNYERPHNRRPPSSTAKEGGVTDILQTPSTIESNAVRPQGAAAPIEQKAINLALQGGGAHGAFTWGVLDRLLEDTRITIDGISAGSAGAMNAVVATYGWSVGGREGAKRALADFWRRLSDASLLGPLQASWFDRAIGNHSLSWSPAFLVLDVMTRLFSPYQLNPMNHNPLRGILIASVDFDALRGSACPIKLFLSATNVRTGKVKVFAREEITAESVLASACLPLMFQAVKIDGEHYWDGGYMGNPALFPLIYNCSSRDILIVHINPLYREELPHTAADILNRINEISFNSSLMREMRAVSFVTRLIDEKRVIDNSLRRMLIHSISADEQMTQLSAASKMNADWSFLTRLRDIGRESAESWISDNFVQIGRESTADVQNQYL